MKDSNVTEKKLPALVRDAWHGLNRIFLNKIKKIGLTPNQYTALRWIHTDKKRDFTQSRLAELMNTDANNISALVTRMEKLNLVKRIPGLNDKRQNNIKPTKLGSDLFQKGKIIAEKIENDSLSCFSKREREDFKNLLDKLSNQIEFEKNNYK